MFVGCTCYFLRHTARGACVWICSMIASNLSDFRRKIMPFFANTRMCNVAADMSNM